MKYAVVKIQGKQYKIAEGDEILVDKISSEKVEFETLLIVDGEDVNVGKPTLDKNSIKFSVIAQEEKGEKVNIFKYKPKSRYRKRMGFRPQFTRLKVEKI